MAFDETLYQTKPLSQAEAFTQTETRSYYELPPNEVLSLDSVSIAYGDRQLIRNISCQFFAGEFIAILGENGAGKSTLLRSIAGDSSHLGFNCRISGRIAFAHKLLAEWTASKLAAKRAVMEQQTPPPAFISALQLVAMGRYCHDESEAAANQIAEKWLQYLGLEAFTHQELIRLSGGEQQRTHLARCFAQLEDSQSNIQSNGKMLLLDEPTSALDVYHQHRCLEHAKQFAKAGNLVIAVMHDINLAALYANRIALLHEGRLLALGHPNEVLKEKTLETMYGVKMSVYPHPTDATPIVVSRAIN